MGQFFRQVTALVRKDLQVARFAWKMSVCELLTPIICSALCGILTVLLTNLSTSGSEWSDLYSPSFPHPSTALAAVENGSRLQSLFVSNFEHAMGNDTSLNLTYNASSALVRTQVLLESFESDAPVFGVASSDNTAIDMYYAAWHGSVRAAMESATAGALALAGAMPGHPLGANVTATVRTIDVPFNMRAIFANLSVVLLIYSFVPGSLINGSRLVTDKTRRVRETLRVMGVSDGAYTVSNFVSSILRMLLGSIIGNIVLVATGAVEANQLGTIILAGFFFTLAMISFAQMMPAFFATEMSSNAFTALILAGSAALAPFTTGASAGLQGLACFLSPVAFFYAILPSLAKGSMILETKQSSAIFMLLVDALLYYAVAYYVYSVRPGEFGVPKHPLFFIRWMWTSKKAPAVAADKMDQAKDTTSINGGNDLFINVRGLVKQYPGSAAPSVDHLNLDVREREVFALLGHNGAGKTTTMSMLTGLLDATSYETATVGGYDLHEAMDKIRANIALCPQFDVLFDQLTCRQHLQLFGALKQETLDTARVESLISALSLPEGQNAGVLSGGTRRRLSVANALVGNAQLILLDEPSSGMDPVSRRQMWGLIKAQKDEGRTIILTTHFMEEADFLGDRIGIMSAGKMKCCATSSELKHQFDVGYTLTIAKGPAATTPALVSAVTEVCGTEGVSVKQDSRTELQLQVRAQGSLKTLLRALESRRAELGVENLGLAMCTLEDIFIRLSQEEHDAAHDAPHSESQSSNTGAHERLLATFNEAPNLSPNDRFWPQLHATMRRCRLTFMRNHRVLMLALLLPIMIMALAFLSLQKNQQSDEFSVDYTWVALESQSLSLVVVHTNDADKATTMQVQRAFERLLNKTTPMAVTWLSADSYQDYATGVYIPVRTIGFGPGSSKEVVHGGFMPHSYNLTTKQAQYTQLWNGDYEPALLIPVAAAWRVATDAVLTGTVDAAVANFPAVHVPVQFVPTVAGGNGTTVIHLTPVYNVMSVGIYTVFVTGHVANMALRLLNDEVARKIYRMLLLQGQLPSSYITGHMLWGLLWTIFPIAIFVVGGLLHPIEQLVTSALLPIVLALALFTVHTTLLQGVFMVYLPNRAPFMYGVLQHVFNLLTMGGPYMIDVAMRALHFSGRDAVRPYVLSAFPACAWYHLFDVASSLQKDQSTAARLFSIAADPVTGNARTGLCLIFLAVELIVPLYLLRSFTTGTGVYAWVLRRRNGTAPAPATAPDGAAAGEATPLLDDQQCSTAAVNMTSLSDRYVAEEERRIAASTQMLTIDHLHKRFGTHTAVQSLSIGVDRNECFGLLGPNGAGKTTTCACVLRELQPTAGRIQYNDGALSSDMPLLPVYNAARIGACMQGDTLWPFLDAREHMDQFLTARLAKLYVPEQWSQYVDNALASVTLDAGTKQAGGYSGGMKRKLQVCLAIFTGSRIVFLDEPSTGMDPFARRALWDVIRSATGRDAVVVLTTHSMDEAEAVCSRIGIMTGGTLRCIGSPQVLKAVYGTEFLVVVEFDETVLSMSQPEADALADRVGADLTTMFGEAKRVEFIGALCHFQVPPLASLADAFDAMDARIADWHVRSYSVSQVASLEQIFVNMVKTSGVAHDDN